MWALESAFNLHRLFAAFVETHIRVCVTVERSFGWRLVCNELVICAHLNVPGVVVDLATDVAVLAGLHVDVVVDLNLGLGEVAEGDSAVEGVFEWLF